MKLSLAVSALIGSVSVRQVDGVRTLLPHMEKKVEYTNRVDLENSRSNAQRFQGYTTKGREVPCENGLIAEEYPCLNMNLANFIPKEELGSLEVERQLRLSDIWGWTNPQNGKEYSLVGMWDGVSIVDMSNPRNPKVIGFIETTDGFTDNGGLWRDLKVIGNVAYIGYVSI